MGGRREVSFISHRPVTSSDLKHERLFVGGSVSTVLQLVVAAHTLSIELWCGVQFNSTWVRSKMIRRTSEI